MNLPLPVLIFPNYNVLTVINSLSFGSLKSEFTNFNDFIAVPIRFNCLQF